MESESSVMPDSGDGVGPVGAAVSVLSCRGKSTRTDYLHPVRACVSTAGTTHFCLLSAKCLRKTFFWVWKCNFFPNLENWVKEKFCLDLVSRHPVASSPFSTINHSNLCLTLDLFPTQEWKKLLHLNWRDLTLVSNISACCKSNPENGVFFNKIGTFFCNKISTDSKFRDKFLFSTVNRHRVFMA